MLDDPEVLAQMVPGLEDENARLRAEVARLTEFRDWVLDGADHHPGCSGAFPPHRCKCGLRELLSAEAGDTERPADWNEVDVHDGPGAVLSAEATDDQEDR